MDLTLFGQGMWIGLSIAAPVGPIGILCIRRSIADGRWIGFLCGLGAAVADAVYGAVAAFGLTMVANAMASQRTLLQLLGGLFLCYLGVRTFRTPPATQEASVRSGGGVTSFASTFVLTLTNPMTIMGFVGLFAGAGLAGNKTNSLGAIAMVTGVFLGSAAWWLFLSWGASTLKNRITSTHLGWLNKISGSVLSGYGLWQVAQFLRK